MSGDERESDNDVGEPIESNPPAPQAADVPRPRPFAAWSSAQQEEEGVLGKIGKRISGMFKRAPKPESAPEEPVVELDAPLDLESAAPEAEELIDATATTAPVEDFAPEIPSAPIEDFAPEIPSAPIEDFAPEIPSAPVEDLAPSAPADEPVVMWTPDYTPETEKPEPIFTPVDSPIVETAPAAEMAEPEPFEPLGDDTTEPMLVPPVIEPPKKKGFFATLFGRKPKRVEPDVPADVPADVTADVTADVETDVTADVEPIVETPVEATLELTPEPVMEPAPPAPPAPPVRASREMTLSELLHDEELIRTDEHEVPVPEELPLAEQTFASVEEALPADELAIEEEEPVEEPKRGFFSRLFAKKPKPARPSLEIEVHEDRIEAAAHALDEVSGESFASPAEAGAGEETFASVEDALPIEDTPDESPDEGGATRPIDVQAIIGEPSTRPIDVQSIIGEPSTRPIDVEAIIGEPTTRPIDVAAISADQLRFAPPPAAPAPPEPVADSRSTLEIEPFDPYAGSTDERDTVETTADGRSTLEMEREARSTEEIELEKELGLSGLSDTLEVEEKTDEFEVPVLDVDTERDTDEVDQPEDGSDTTEVAKQTWWARLLGIKPKTVEKKKPLPAGTVVEGNPNFLFSKFRAFYNEIIRVKHQKSQFSAGFATAIVTDYTADLSPDAAAASQSQALMQMLELQLAEANWMGGEARERYPDAQYAMAALADEIFLHLEWDGQAAWRNHLLEIKLFRSRAADVELFKRIDKLLKERPNSHVARDLARVYLMVLAAGFQGKYRPFGLTRALAEYRQRLFEYIHQGDALMLYAPERRIFPEAASHTREGHAVSRFSGAQRWAAILLLMVIGYTALAHYAWNRVSADLKDVTERIKAASSTSAGSPSGTTTANTTRNGSGQ